jgi:hypothetical protein
MNDKQLLDYWHMGLAIGIGIVAVVAALLLALIATARSILANANHALKLLKEIVSTTRPVWALEHTATVAAQLRKEVEKIEQHAAEVADALAAPPTER